MAVQATTFEALGRTWTFKFGFAAICRLEREHDKPFGQIMAEMLPGLTPELLKDPMQLASAAASMRFDHLGSIIAAGLGEQATSGQVAEIIDELGFEEALAVIFGASENDVTGGPAPKKARGRGPKKPAA